MAVLRHLWGLLASLSLLTEIKFSGQIAHRTQSDKTVFVLKFHPRTSAHPLRGYFKTEVRIFGSNHSFLFAPLNVSRDVRKAARHFCHTGWTVTANTPRLFPHVYFNEVFTSNLEKGFGERVGKWTTLGLFFHKISHPEYLHLICCGFIPRKKKLNLLLTPFTASRATTLWISI